ncbi:HNH endonuclease [Escherichia coli]|uniref:HNH endonuclease n=1 Tax=Escherichia coli TaxID=562 RepID=UPI0039A76730|nr:HNH endonuclease [Escherichia coli]
MSNEIKFEFIKKNWELRDGVIYSKRTGKPISFCGTDNSGHRFTITPINGKRYCVRIHEAVFILHHDRPIAENKEIHHKDGNPANNAVDNLIELTPKQHRRIHQYQYDDPMRGIRLVRGALVFRWLDDNGTHRCRSFHGINEAMTFRAEIEEPRRQELRALGLNCKRSGNGPTRATMRRLNQHDRLCYRCRH